MPIDIAKILPSPDPGFPVPSSRPYRGTGNTSAQILLGLKRKKMDPPLHPQLRLDIIRLRDA